MATAGRVVDAPPKIAHYLWLTARAGGTSGVIEVAQEYLESWSGKSVANVQKVDAGWAPFDANQRPQQLNSASDLRCIRDAIHAHCMALREARMALPPELVELDEFFFVATELTEALLHLVPRPNRAASKVVRKPRSRRENFLDRRVRC
jgi:hypothetical protein